MRLLLILGFVTWHVTNPFANGHPFDYLNVIRVIDSVGNFSRNFFQTVAVEESSNMVCSPYSASMLLSLMSFGTRGMTKNNIRLSLGFSQSDDIIQIGIRSLTKRLSVFQKVNLLLGTKIFFNGPIQNAEFQHVMEKTFNSISQNIDFTDKINARRIINDWGASQTDNHINEIVQSVDFDLDTEVMVVNAAYFKGRWATQFETIKTQPRPFLINGASKDVPTMYQLGSYRYGELPDLNARFIKLPYETMNFANDLTNNEREVHCLIKKNLIVSNRCVSNWNMCNTAANDEISMYIVLPNEHNGITSLKKNIRDLTLTTLSGGTETKVELYLPKFKIKSKLDLKVPFNKLGAINRFRYGLFVTDIANKSVHINRIAQDAFIEVNENGNKISYDSARVNRPFENILDYESLSEPIKFVVDRPFISIIATEPGLLLFGAIVMDPSY